VGFKYFKMLYDLLRRADATLRVRTVQHWGFKEQRSILQAKLLFLAGSIVKIVSIPDTPKIYVNKCCVVSATGSVTVKREELLLFARFFR